jgi:hypothetical protein
MVPHCTRNYSPFIFFLNQVKKATEKEEKDTVLKHKSIIL